VVIPGEGLTVGDINQSTPACCFCFFLLRWVWGSFGDVDVDVDVDADVDVEVGVDVDVDVDVDVVGSGRVCVVVAVVGGLVRFLLLEFVVHSVKSRCRADTNIGVVPL